MARSPLELRIWDHYTEEEKSMTLLNAYKNRVLLTDDVKEFLHKDRVNVWATWGFPLVAYGALYITSVTNRSVVYKYPRNYRLYFPAIATAFLWLGWVNYSPFQATLDKEKFKLLDLVDRRIGVQMKSFNDMVPRMVTTQELHRRMRQLMNERHSVFTNVLYPSEEAQAPLQDLSNYQWKQRRDKLVK